MKRVTKEAALLATTVLCMGMTASSQLDRPRYEFGINFGFLVYQGDLTPKQLGSFETQRFSLGLHASKIMSPSFSWRANLLIGSLKGDDAKYSKPEYRLQRNFLFTSPAKELSIQMVWNPLARNYTEKGFSPYVFAGGGLSLLKIKRDWSRINTSYFSSESSEIWAGLAADSAHTLPKVIPVVPLGAGVKYFFSPRWAVNAESSYRLSFTDYIDGFSQAVNPKKNDHYLNYAVGVIYRTGNKNRLGCPVVKY